jgi:hypothetical protein
MVRINKNNNIKIHLFGLWRGGRYGCGRRGRSRREEGLVMAV